MLEEIAMLIVKYHFSSVFSNKCFEVFAVSANYPDSLNFCFYRAGVMPKTVFAAVTFSFTF